LFRSWSTPIVVAGGGVKRNELVVSGQDELRGYDLTDGRHVWTVKGLTGWVAPSPVFAQGLIFAASGRNGPLLAVRPGGRGDVTGTHVVWRHETGGPYVCSPVVQGDELFVHNEQGVLACYDARTGREHYRQRLAGKFSASPVAAEGRILATSEEGVTCVVRAGRRFELLAKNELGERCLASPAIAGDSLLIRTEKHLFRLGSHSLTGRGP
jgi:outer membrane protein assembly factor BamB